MRSKKKAKALKESGEKIPKNSIHQVSTADGYGKFKIELLGTGIRYVIVIPDHITLAKVHEIIQMLFKWDEDHLWDFRDECGRRYMDECVWGVHDDVIEDCIPPSKAILADVLSMRGDKLIYTFDFGDDNKHIMTRMAAPKAPGCYCVKSEYAPSPEWEYFEYEMPDDDCETWRQPSIEEVDAMLKSIL